ncbi:MAG: acyl carrier protein [Acidimicrobiaceae bacterium]|nr:acyl carrier protein [Ilumatobacter sp.]MCB9382161.1 acyl carrier protein [Acidimicrobiaceae bacterium]
MDADALRAELRSFIATNFLFADVSSVDDEASLLTSGVIDSTGAMELISHLEELLGTSFPDDALVADNFDSVDKMLAFATPFLQ